MGKKALVAKTEDVQFLFTQDWKEPHERVIQLNNDTASRLFQVNSFLCDRDLCESDPTMVQFIPYTPIVSTLGSWEAEVFMYRRGEKGDEKSLHGMWSIGIGGHVESAPDEIKGVSLETVLTSGLRQEAWEEVGLDLGTFQANEALRRAQVLHDTRSPTEAVHLGLITPIFCKKEKVGMNSEPGIIDKGRWMNVQELAHLHATGQVQLEPWSIFALKHLAALFRPLDVSGTTQAINAETDSLAASVAPPAVALV